MGGRRFCKSGLTIVKELSCHNRTTYLLNSPTFLLLQHFKIHVITVSRHLKQPSNGMTIIRRLEQAARSLASAFNIRQRLNNSNRKELEDHTSSSADAKSKPP